MTTRACGRRQNTRTDCRCRHPQRRARSASRRHRTTARVFGGTRPTLVRWSRTWRGQPRCEPPPALPARSIEPSARDERVAATALLSAISRREDWSQLLEEAPLAASAVAAPRGRRVGGSDRDRRLHLSADTTGEVPAPTRRPVVLRRRLHRPLPPRCRLPRPIHGARTAPTSTGCYLLCSAVWWTVVSDRRGFVEALVAALEPPGAPQCRSAAMPQPARTMSRHNATPLSDLPLTRGVHSP